MSRKYFFAAALIGIVACTLTACDNNNNHNRNNYAGSTGTGVTINVDGAIAEGGEGGDGGNVANQGGQIAQDESIAADVEIDATTTDITAIDSIK